MKYTSNLNLKKPDGTDIVDINDLNENMDILDTELARKQDKVAGKGLSTEDFTTAEKNKLAGIATGAQPNAVVSVAGKTGAVTVTKSDVGLHAVENYGVATTAEAEAGTSNSKYMTPLRVKEAVAKLAPPSNPTIATQAQAEAGTDNAAMMTALRVKQAIDKFLVYR